MINKVISASAVLLAMSAYGAQAQVINGEVVMYDSTYDTLTLDGGQSFVLRPGRKPTVRLGERVVVTSVDNHNGIHYVDYIGPATAD
ncbi:hypothetical protein DUT91_22770 [Phyllobacterium salinisoli]|uniref:DUF1344 domain-containing protein n=1 Tax=Phyllobacterium salinisoli TaxID=1899321 RepID=A0A368JXF4_9HYPH|nr:hypothetical protein [Phyllobacterium salinisoli]RCS21631.1 hypothetical protein DUT91_22770 [Phyllobacterium salinisoli]